MSRIFLFHHSATGKLEARLLQVQRSSILPPCISQFYARLSFSATRDKSSSTDNNCPSTLQHLLNGTPYGYLYIRYQPRCVIVLLYTLLCIQACDTSTTATGIAPAHSKILSIALVIYTYYTYVQAPSIVYHYY